MDFGGVVPVGQPQGGLILIVGGLLEGVPDFLRSSEGTVVPVGNRAVLGEYFVEAMLHQFDVPADFGGGALDMPESAVSDGELVRGDEGRFGVLVEELGGGMGRFAGGVASEHALGPLVVGEVAGGWKPPAQAVEVLGMTEHRVVVGGSVHGRRRLLRVVSVELSNIHQIKSAEFADMACFQVR